MAAQPPPVNVTVSSSEEVEQVVHEDERVLLHKQVVQVSGPESQGRRPLPPLHLVRKHLPAGPTRAPVLLVHGFAQNRYSWHTSRRSMSAWLAREGWDVWNLELRGHGRSRDEGVQGAETFHDYVDDLLLAQRALPSPAFWVGHSLGGTVCYAAATRLTDTPGAGTRGVVGIGALYRFGQSNWLVKLLCNLTHSSPWVEHLQVRTRLAGLLLSRLYGVSDILGYTFPISGWWPGNMEPEILAERLDRGFDWTSVKVWREMSRWCATDHFDDDAAWQHTDVPLLVVLGDEDHLMPPADGRAAYDRSGSRDRTLLVLDDWHYDVHWGHLDLVLGRLAPGHVWASIHQWMAAR